MALIVPAFVIAAYGESGETGEDAEPEPAAGRSAQPGAASAPCDDALRRKVEVMARAALEKAAREDDGITYQGEMNSGCATINVPPDGDARP